MPQKVTMESHIGPARRRFQDHVLVWDKKFTVRREDAHHHEDNKLAPDDVDDDDETIIDAFLSQFSSRLDPPQYSYKSVRNFLYGITEDDRKPILYLLFMAKSTYYWTTDAIALAGMISVMCGIFLEIGTATPVDIRLRARMSFFA